MADRTRFRINRQTITSSNVASKRSDKQDVTQAVAQQALDHISDVKNAKYGGKKSMVCRAQDAFRYAANCTAQAMGSAITFVAAVAIVVGWAICGPVFHYSENWQLVINTGTTIVTFLMIFLVQNTQNRESRAIQLKLDELLRGVKGARTNMVDLENATDEELAALQQEFEQLRKSPRRDSAERAANE